MTVFRGRRLRVLLLCHEMSLSGAPRLAYDIVRTLGPEIELRTISGSDGGLEGSFRDLGPVDVLSWAPPFLQVSQHPAGILVSKVFRRLRARAVGARARLWRPDVVYANSAASVGLIPQLGLGGLPILLYVHELTLGLARLTDRQRRLIRALPTRYAAVSRIVAEDIVTGQGIDPERVVVIPPLVDAERIAVLAGGLARDASRDPRTPFIVGGAGYPHWTKGIELWLLTARALVDRMGQGAVEFEWVGVYENPAADEFQAMIGKLGLQSSVRLVPATANPYPHFRRFDVFAMTSWEESASLVVLESMALEIPVVCFAGSGGPPEQLGETGIVIERFSPSDMADAIATLLAEPERRQQIGTDERELVAAVNDPGRIAALLLGELANVASGVRQRPQP